MRLTAVNSGSCSVVYDFLVSGCSLATNYLTAFNFTADKRKKKRHFRFFKGLKFKWAPTFTSVKFTLIRVMHKISRQAEIHGNETCGWQFILNTHMR